MNRARRHPYSALRRPSTNGGFTLLELVIVALVIVTIVTLATPNLVQSIRNNATSSQNLALTSMLNLAKSEAIRRNTDVTVVFTVLGNNWSVIVEDPAEEADIEGCVPGQLRCASYSNAALTVGVSELVFNNRGYIRGVDDAWTPETIFLQHDQCDGPNQRRRIDITPTGQISSCALPCGSVASCP